MDFPTSVAPFILRNVTLAGVDSVMQPLAVRKAAWDALAAEVDLAQLQRIAHDVALDQVLEVAANIMAGQSQGRAVVAI
jgi:acrylyl-CoA reductase (NADPH)